MKLKSALIQTKNIELFVKEYHQAKVFLIYLFSNLTLYISNTIHSELNTCTALYTKCSKFEIRKFIPIACILSSKVMLNRNQFWGHHKNMVISILISHEFCDRSALPLKPKILNNKPGNKHCTSFSIASGKIASGEMHQEKCNHTRVLMIC